VFPPSEAGARVSRAKFSRELQLRKLLLNRRRRVLLSLKLGFRRRVRYNWADRCEGRGRSVLWIQLVHRNR